MHKVSSLTIPHDDKILTCLLTVNGKSRLVPYKEWSDLIQASFEKCYYVPLGKV